MIARLFRKFLTADVLGLMLVVLALNIMVHGISASLRSTETNYFYHVSMIAALIGISLSTTKWNGMQATAWIVALGVAGAWILGAGLAVPLIDLGKAGVVFLQQIIPAIRSHAPIDTTSFHDAWYPIALSSSALWLRWQTWLSGIHGNFIANDPLIRSLIWLLLLWFISAWVGWFTKRRNAVLALMPALILLALVTSYSERTVESLWMMVCVLLLLMGVWNYKRHMQQWERQKVDYSESIPFDVTQAVFLVSMMIAALAFVTPSISWHEIRDYLRERNQASENQTAEILGIQQSVAPAKIPSSPKPTLPRDHLLSGGFATSPKVVMIIKTSELQPMPYEMNVMVQRHYWRSVTYDQYLGSGWESSSVTPQIVQPNTPLIPGLLADHKLIHMDVEMVEPEGKLFWSGTLFSAGVPFTVNWRVRPQSSLFADRSALLQADMFAATTKAAAFDVDTYIPFLTVDELRAASSEYPEYIENHYLALPDSVPERVRALSHKITKGMDNPYEKATAIEHYLRTNYPYDLNIPAPPEDQDVADYFLFDLKKGYCDYYATAMVVLARSSGLPARFVSGYASGSYDILRAEYIVREMDAHSWAEIYFPEIGWVEFEPTASEPEIQRAQPEELISVNNQSRSQAKNLLLRFQLETNIYWLLSLISLLALFILCFTLIQKWLFLRLAPSIAIEQIYRRLYRLGRPLAGERTRAETSHEFIIKLCILIDELENGSRFKRVLSTLKTEVVALTDLFHSTLFIDHLANERDASNAWRIWISLRWHLLFARVLVFITQRKQHIFARKLQIHQP